MTETSKFEPLLSTTTFNPQCTFLLLLTKFWLKFKNSTSFKDTSITAILQMGFSFPLGYWWFFKKQLISVWVAGLTTILTSSILHFCHLALQSPCLQFLQEYFSEKIQNLEIPTSDSSKNSLFFNRKCKYSSTTRQHNTKQLFSDAQLPDKSEPEPAERARHPNSSVPATTLGQVSRFQRPDHAKSDHNASSASCNAFGEFGVRHEGQRAPTAAMQGLLLRVEAGE